MATAPTPISFNAGQSMAVVRDRLWIFDKADTNHNLAAGFVRNASDLRYIGVFQHNISHAATADYEPDTDTVMLGNAGDENSAAPRVDLFAGFSHYNLPVFLDWYDQASTPRISIPLVRFAEDGTTVVRSAFPDTKRRTTNAVWVDNHTILAFAESATGLTAVTIQLGRGSEDFSADGYGTFLPGKGRTAFNGTAQALAVYTNAIKGTTQDAAWHNGHFYLAFTASAASKRTVEVLEFALGSGGALQLTDDYSYFATKPDGTRYTFEVEGLAFRGNEMLVTAVRDDGYQSIYRFDSTSSVTDLQP